MRKTGVYIRSGSSKKFSGVDGKVKNQIKAFSSQYEMKEIIIQKKPTNAFKAILNRMPLGSFGRDYETAKKDIELLSDVEFFYIRNSAWDREWTDFLKWLRVQYPNSKVVLEIPTHPYGSELLKNKEMWPFFFKDIIWRKNAVKYVDRIVTFSEDDYIWGIPTIKSQNGIVVDDITPITETDDHNEVIRMIAVAMMQPYHGFERLIKGLYIYYKSGRKRHVKLKMVGYGPELENYQNLVKELGLADKIVFTGKLSGDELDLAYDGCDLAIGSMGGYKIGIDCFSSIKLGEYLAKGLPVITGARTLVFDKYGSDYNLNFPNDSSEIDVDKIVAFYDSLYCGKKKSLVHREIREFAKNTIDVHTTMSGVLEYLESDT